MLSIADIKVRYGALEVLKGVSADLAAGSFTTLIGPNGTGKSSLLKAICGLLPSHGTVSLSGQPLVTSAERGHKIAYLQQDIGPTSSLTILEVVLLGRLTTLGLRVPSHLCDEAMTLLSRFGIQDLRTRTLAEVSGGQRQLAYLAQSIFRNPQVFLLDEPTAALDLRHQLIVLEAVRAYSVEHNVIVIAAMHDLNLGARFADRMICLSEGFISADGAPFEIITPAIIEQVYGVHAEVSNGKTGFLTVMPLAALDTSGKSADVMTSNLSAYRT